MVTNYLKDKQLGKTLTYIVFVFYGFGQLILLAVVWNIQLLKTNKPFNVNFPATSMKTK